MKLFIAFVGIVTYFLLYKTYLEEIITGNQHVTHPFMQDVHFYWDYIVLDDRMIYES